MKDFQWPATVIDVIEIDGNFHHGIVLAIPVPSSRTSLRPVGYSKEYINAPVGRGKPQILLDNFQNPDVETGSKDDLELIQERRIQPQFFEAPRDSYGRLSARATIYTFRYGRLFVTSLSMPVSLSRHRAASLCFADRSETRASILSDEKGGFGQK